MYPQTLTSRRPCSILRELGRRFHYAVIGLVLVAVFIWRLALGLASLSVALPESSILAPNESAPG
jgi:hypothetical protein